jgi:hypothetical protein
VASGESSPLHPGEPDPVAPDGIVTEFEGGPTDSRRYISLGQALADQHVPVENHTLIRRITRAIEISGYYERSSYIRADRADGGRALWIAYGWTAGFKSEEEAIAAAGPDVARWPSGRSGLWGVWHPVNRGHAGGGGRRREDSDYGTCPKCFIKLPVSGRCDYCDL